MFQFRLPPKFYRFFPQKAFDQIDPTCFRDQINIGTLHAKSHPHLLALSYCRAAQDTTFRNRTGDVAVAAQNAVLAYAQFLNQKPHHPAGDHEAKIALTYYGFLCDLQNRYSEQAIGFAQHIDETRNDAPGITLRAVAYSFLLDFNK